MSASVSGDNTAIREGFLCPICMQDLNSVYQLQTHFEENHSSEDKAVVHHLKEFFGKAKKFLGKSEEQPVEREVAEVEEDEGERSLGLTTPSSRVSGIDDTQWAPQEQGAVRSYYQYFRSQRSSHVDRNTVETNKLLIRLEKLVMFNRECNDPSKRKGKRARRAFEKTVAPWKLDSSMKFCPFCMERFGLSLRRHHCRLCGNIACLKCSDFLPKACSDNLLKTEQELVRDHQKEQARQAKGAEGGEDADEDMSGTLRLCKNCDQLLVRRLQAVRAKVIKPNIVLLYQRLSEVKNHVIAQLSVYNPKIESLLYGSSAVSRDAMERERAKILKNFDLIDTISKKILALPTSTPTNQRLIQKIRSNCTLFLQANMHTMVTLPTKEKIEKLKEERRAAIARRIQEEKQAELEAQRQERQERLEKEKRELKDLEGVKQGHVRIPSWPLSLNKNKQETSPTKGGTSGAKTLEGGWKPSAVSQAELMASSDNPMVQQMNIIRNYIRQAKEMQRTDEVRMLEENLKELEMEYGRQSRF